LKSLEEVSGHAFALWAAMTSSFDVFLRRLRDPRWIPHISSYCDSRCSRCAFTERCWSYALQQHVTHVADESSPTETAVDVETEPESSPVVGWAERHGIDLNDIQLDASDTKAYEELRAKIDNDPLGLRAHDYGMDVWAVMRPHLENDSPAGPVWSAEVAEAIRDVWGLALTIGAKTHRAVGSFEHEREEEIETDAVQTDANGSAKVVRLAIVTSLAAWEIVRGAGVMDAGLIDHLVENLKQIEAELTARFPLALAFVRPGFDERIPGIVRPWSIMPDEEEDEEEDDVI
jgi:hypothetical protein